MPLNLLEGQSHLIAAITPNAAKHVSGQTFGVHPDYSWLVRFDCAFHKRDMLVGVDYASVRYGHKLTVFSRDSRFSGALD